MKNEQEKSTNRIYFYLIIAALAVFAYVQLFGSGNVDTSAELHQRTDRTVEEIEAEHENAGRELDVATGQLNSAGEATSRADEFVKRSQERVKENTASITDCQRIVGKCQAIIKDSQRIMCDIEKANTAGTGSSGG